MIKAYIYIFNKSIKNLLILIIIPKRFAYDNNINSGRLKYFFSTTLKLSLSTFFINLYCCSNNFRLLNENGKKLTIKFYYSRRGRNKNRKLISISL